LEAFEKLLSSEFLSEVDKDSWEDTFKSNLQSYAQPSESRLSLDGQTSDGFDHTKAKQQMVICGIIVNLSHKFWYPNLQGTNVFNHKTAANIFFRGSSDHADYIDVDKEVFFGRSSFKMIYNKSSKKSIIANCPVVDDEENDKVEYYI